MNSEISNRPFRENFHDHYKMAFYLILISLGWIISLFTLDPRMWIFVACGATGGIIGHFKMTLIGEMRVDERQRLSILEYLEHIRYHEIDRDFYVMDCHRLLRFKSQNVLFFRKSGSLYMRGPRYLLSIIRRKF